MAVASTNTTTTTTNSADFYLLGESSTPPTKMSEQSTASSSPNSKNDMLNFYESMYHFRKMFPNIDSDVIECVLRGNSGAIDKTIDQLLTLNQNENENESIPTKTKKTSLYTNDIHNENSSDQPPSYTEFMSSKTLTTDVVVDLNVDTSSKSVQKVISLFQNKDTVNTNRVSSILNTTNSIIQQKGDDYLKQASTPSSLRNTEAFIVKFNKIVIGDLAKDFLRVKLTSDQVKKIKCSIKRAKRSEIAAIVNNKTPENPDLSFEMRKRLNTLKEQVKEDDADEFNNEKEPWRQRVNEVSKSFEKKRQQMLQDEYLAKLIQNEEFLNELKTDKDFIQTLNYGKLGSFGFFNFDIKPECAVF